MNFCVWPRSRFCLWCQIAFSWFAILSNRWVTAATAAVFVTISKLYPRVRYIHIRKGASMAEDHTNQQPQQPPQPLFVAGILTLQQSQAYAQGQAQPFASPQRTGSLRRSSRTGSLALSNTPSLGAASKAMPSSTTLLRRSPCMPRPRRRRT